MSGYEGGGTYQGNDLNVADANINSYSGNGLSLGSSGLGLMASPGAGLSLAASSSPGLSASLSQVSDFGPANSPGHDFATSNAVQSASTGLALANAASASQKDASYAKTKAAVKTGISMVPGGGLLVAGAEMIGQLFDAIGSAFSGTRSSTGTSMASDLFSGGGDGPPDTGYTGGAPVIGFGGSVVNNTPQTTTSRSGVAPSMFPGLGSYAAGYAPGGGLKYGAGFVPGAQSNASAAPLLLAAASLLFLS